MQQKAIIEWASARMARADDSPLEPGYRLHHGRRVADLALNLARSMQLPVNEDIVYIAGILHDVGKSGGQQGTGHGPRGADIIRAEIPHLFSVEELAAVCHIVANHYMRPKSARFAGKEAPEFPPEVLLIQDADILDHIGCTGIYLRMYWNAHFKETPERLLEQFHKDDAEVDLMRQPLNFPTSIVEFDARWQAIRRFFAMLSREEAGQLVCGYSQ